MRGRPHPHMSPGGPRDHGVDHTTMDHRADRPEPRGAGAIGHRPAVLPRPHAHSPLFHSGATPDLLPGMRREPPALFPGGLRDSGVSGDGSASLGFSENSLLFPEPCNALRRCRLCPGGPLATQVPRGALRGCGSTSAAPGRLGQEGAPGLPVLPTRRRLAATACSHRPRQVWGDILGRGHRTGVV